MSVSVARPAEDSGGALQVGGPRRGGVATQRPSHSHSLAPATTTTGTVIQQSKDGESILLVTH